MSCQGITHATPLLGDDVEASTPSGRDRPPRGSLTKKDSPLKRYPGGVSVTSEPYPYRHAHSGGKTAPLAFRHLTPLPVKRSPLSPRSVSPLEKQISPSSFLLQFLFSDIIHFPASIQQHSLDCFNHTQTSQPSQCPTPSSSSRPLAP